MQLAIETIGDVATVAVPVDELDASNAAELKRDLAPLLQANTRVVLDLESHPVHGQLRIGGDAFMPAAAQRQKGRFETVWDVQAGSGSL